MLFLVTKYNIHLLIAVIVRARRYGWTILIADLMMIFYCCVITVVLELTTVAIRKIFNCLVQNLVVSVCVCVCLCSAYFITVL